MTTLDFLFFKLLFIQADLNDLRAACILSNLYNERLYNYPGVLQKDLDLSLTYKIY